MLARPPGFRTLRTWLKNSGTFLAHGFKHFDAGHTVKNALTYISIVLDPQFNFLIQACLLNAPSGGIVKSSLVIGHTRILQPTFGGIFSKATS